jgi:hypothetical protein
VNESAPPVGSTWKQTWFAAAAPIVRVSSAVSAPVLTADLPHARVVAAPVVAALAVLAVPQMAAASRQPTTMTAERPRLNGWVTDDAPR